MSFSHLVPHNPSFSLWLKIFTHALDGFSHVLDFLHRQNIEQHDIVCKGSCGTTGYRQSHWLKKPTCCKSELPVDCSGAVPIYTRWELLLLLLMHLFSFAHVFYDTNRRNHGKETTSSVMSRWPNNSQYQQGEEGWRRLCFQNVSKHLVPICENYWVFFSPLTLLPTLCLCSHSLWVLSSECFQIVKFDI